MENHILFKEYSGNIQYSGKTAGQNRVDIKASGHSVKLA